MGIAMKGLLAALIFPASILQAVTTEAIIKKYHLVIPTLPEEKINPKACTELRDSSDYYYNPVTGRLDSMVQYNYGMLDNKVSRRLETHEYTPLPKGGYVEKVVHKDKETGEIIFKDIHTYGKDRKLLQTHSVAQMIKENTCSKYYDARGNLIKDACILKEDGDVVSHNTYKYDAKNRQILWRNEAFPPGDYVIQEYNSFDSVVARLSHKPDGVVFPMHIRFYDQQKLPTKSIDFWWNKDSTISAIFVYQHDSLGLRRRSLTVQDTINAFKPDYARFGVTSCNWYDYDDKRRLKRKVWRVRPNPALK